MEEIKKKGKFIVFEGIDGSGKSTQADRLVRYLKSKNIKAVVTNEPQSDRPVGMLIRQALKKQISFDEKTIALLFAADRLDHIQRISEKLDEGFWVVCDRYYFSSFAYNDTALNKEWIISVNSEAMNALKADMTIFLDIPCDISLSRVSKRGEREIFENTERQNRVRNNYLELFKRFKDDENIVVIDGNAKQNIIEKKIADKIDELI
ncbi:MAG: dTMP kinase [Clostridia bacterium]|nr:dTMP kinase [Clostridia bacterium]